MQFYPVNLNMKDKIVLIFGTGKIALRKADRFKDSGAKIIMISKDYSREISSDFLYISKKINMSCLHKDLAGIVNELTMRDIRVVIAATSDRELNHAICNWFQDRNILTNNASDLHDSDFINPSVLRKGPITISVSTNGNSPGATKLLKEELSKVMTEELCQRVEVIGEIRELIRSSVGTEAERRAIMDELLTLDLSALKARRQSFED